MRVSEYDVVVRARLDDVRAVPAHVSELVATLELSNPDPVPDGDERVGAVATDGPLARREARHLVTDDVGAEGDDGRQRPVRREEQVQV